jgi:hypothetical protein
MNPCQARKLAKLQAQLQDAQVASGLVREELIESLGDMLCGSGNGPSPEALLNFRRIELIEKVARRELSRFVAELAMNSLS